MIVMSARDNLLEANKREGESGELINITTTTSTTSKYDKFEEYEQEAIQEQEEVVVEDEEPVQIDPDIYFEEIEHVTSGPSKIFIKKNQNSHYHHFH